MKSILIIEDDLTFSRILKAWFVRRKFEVDTAVNGSEVRKKIGENVPDLIICDLRLPGENGISILEWIKKQHPHVVVIMMTGYADIQSAVMAMKLGAYDYIPKPFNPEELFIKINEAFEPKEAKNNTQTGATSGTGVNDENIVKGSSAIYKKLYEFIDLVAPTKLAVLIEGESGVGKEHVARFIHQKSERAEGPFVAVDCGVISKELAASDFFGHVKGAFTGAIGNKTGYFLSADKGTLFLDEIGNLSIDIQTQLLRALQEKKIKPVGSEKEIDIDVRIIAATNEDIEFAVNNGYFRSDLYHRISEFIINVPSLRESKEDIPAFLHHFLKEANAFLNKNVLDFTPEALEILTQYEWPGNIRELKNIINRLTLIATGDYISAEIIPQHFKETQTGMHVVVDKEEKERIENALKLSRNNLTKAADILDMDTKILHNKIKLYKIVL
ncbi:Transcriptional regulatory protein ZraR [uncultured Paludibacter sp.]|nr:Transcriptional regulatory protein ZraR [uncultured Paludibacter sp.]